MAPSIHPHPQDDAADFAPAAPWLLPFQSSPAWWRCSKRRMRKRTSASISPSTSRRKAICLWMTILSSGGIRQCCFHVDPRPYHHGTIPTTSIAEAASHTDSARTTRLSRHRGRAHSMVGQPNVCFASPPFTADRKQKDTKHLSGSSKTPLQPYRATQTSSSSASSSPANQAQSPVHLQERRMVPTWAVIIHDPAKEQSESRLWTARREYQREHRHLDSNTNPLTVLATTTTMSQLVHNGSSSSTIPSVNGSALITSKQSAVSRNGKTLSRQHNMSSFQASLSSVVSFEDDVVTIHDVCHHNMLVNQTATAIHTVAPAAILANPIKITSTPALRREINCTKSSQPNRKSSTILPFTALSGPSIQQQHPLFQLNASMTMTKILTASSPQGHLSSSTTIFSPIAPRIDSAVINSMLSRTASTIQDSINQSKVTLDQRIATTTASTAAASASLLKPWSSPKSAILKTPPKTIIPEFDAVSSHQSVLEKPLTYSLHTEAKQITTTRAMWRHRNARSLEEGIRRDKTDTQAGSNSTTTKTAARKESPSSNKRESQAKAVVGDKHNPSNSQVETKPQKFLSKAKQLSKLLAQMGNSVKLMDPTSAAASSEDFSMLLPGERQAWQSRAMAASGSTSMAYTTPPYTQYPSSSMAKKRYVARSIAGLIHALAEDADDLEVRVDARPDTPLWAKQVDAVRIQFSRLGFKPLRMGGGLTSPPGKTTTATTATTNTIPESNPEYATNGVAVTSMQPPTLYSLGVSRSMAGSRHSEHHHASNVTVDLLPAAAAAAASVPVVAHDSAVIDRNGSMLMMSTGNPNRLIDVASADEAFDRIDVDKNGALDSKEIAHALNLAALSTIKGANQKMGQTIQTFASDLVKLYDFNGDGVVDRDEYRSMVEDMAALSQAKVQQQLNGEDGWLGTVKRSVSNMWRRMTGGSDENVTTTDTVIAPAGTIPAGYTGASEIEQVKGYVVKSTNTTASVTADRHYADILDSAEIVGSMTKLLGSITFLDLKVDLRRLLFGALPVLKHITPGGPLILEPFTTTINGSFSRDDIMNSFLLDAALRRLVARALRRRVGSLRDFFEGAVFKGRSWRMFSDAGPAVSIPKFTDIEFDSDNRLVLTGRARVQTRPGAPVIENAFKIRTKIGTRQGGRVVRLEEPELALVLECPTSWESNLGKICRFLNIKSPEKPKPIYSFFPIYSPFKVEDNDGFDLGEDNCLSAIFVANGALHFELSAILRPGRFLGSHYVAFTIPKRTFIVTLDRIKQGIRAARKAKKAARALKMASQRQEGRRMRARRILSLDDNNDDDATTTDPNWEHRGNTWTKKRVQPKSFFSRFVEGYLSADWDNNDTEGDSEKLSDAIREFFGRQARERMERH